MALQATELTDVFELCKLLAMAAQEALEEHVFPHNDAACKIIAHQIAFSCNGDLPFMPHYAEAYQYCQRIVTRDNAGIPTTEQEDKPIEPIYKAS